MAIISPMKQVLTVSLTMATILLVGCGGNAPAQQQPVHQQSTPAPTAAHTPPAQPAGQPTSAAPNAAYAAGEAWASKALNNKVLPSEMDLSDAQYCYNSSELTASGAIPPYSSFVAGCVAGFKAAGH
jgi:hypothetical protein